MTVIHGDCLAVMPPLDEASVDAIVCDPPYALTANKKGGSGMASFDPSTPYGRSRVTVGNGAGGFMGKAWDAALPTVEMWREALRVARPGAHLVAFGGTRTFHRLVCAIEDAGWEIRDTLMWLYGSGFPKSLDVSKAMDKAAGAERPVLGRSRRHGGSNDADGPVPDLVRYGTAGDVLTQPVTDLARQWQGWGTALKPAHEPILVCSKPLTMEQHFTILARLLTSIVSEAALCGGVSASDVERSSCAIRARLQKGADSSVLEGARIRSWASIGLVPSAGASSTSPADTWAGPHGTRGDTALSHVRPSSNAAETSEPTIPPGPADDLLTRLMAMCTSVIAGGISESTVSLWSSISADLLDAASTYTTETASRLTTALRTLNSLMLPLISGDTGSSSPSLPPNATPIILARKPLTGTVAATVSQYGTGALNVDECRITAGRDYHDLRVTQGGADCGVPLAPARAVPRAFEQNAAGRWPANVVLDEEAAALLDAQSGERPVCGGPKKTMHDSGMFGIGQPGRIYEDRGGASRFFYCAKASRREREAGLEGMPAAEGSSTTRLSPTDNMTCADCERTHPATYRGPCLRCGADAVRFAPAKMDGTGRDRASGKTRNVHPTVKPLALMRWLCRLVTPPGGLILDPFCGSGSTLCAAVLEGFRAIGIEREEEYVRIAERRVAHYACGSSGKGIPGSPPDSPLPLFETPETVGCGVPESERLSA